ncbi:MAG: HpcH/HpaI aldolase family protein, partial [Burkholderiaceae bacterium]
MVAPINLMKQKLLKREATIGCWLTLASPAVAEAVAHCGCDWLLIDAEHGPSDIQNIFAQLQAIDAARAHGASAHAAVRVSWNNAPLVKRIMDCGAQTIMFPAIETAEEAALAVAATRYLHGNSQGVRGVASTVRAATYSLDKDYLATANQQSCVIVLVESAKAFENVEEIAATEGVDCVFIGPSDFAASLGYLGNSTHSDVQTAIAYITAVCAHHGKAIGIYAPDVQSAKRYRDMGMH